MEIGLEEVKRHLDILGYTNIEPTLLNEFVEDLKKLIEYDQKHGDVNRLSSSTNKDCNDSYSEQLKTSTTNDTFVNISPIISSGIDRRKLNHLRENQRNQDNSLRTSSKIINNHNTDILNNVKYEPEYMQQECYFCAYIPMENQQKMKLKHRSNPLPAIQIGATFNIQL